MGKMGNGEHRLGDPTMTTELATEAEHLEDLRRELPDWLRAHAGWTESALHDACSTTAAAIGSERMGATAAVEGACVHLHLDCGRDLDLEAR
jgi:hypothetical protein